ncbi:sensor histidine kinase [Cryptosporangium sp. NPDC048952]|uniref:sensor histidine kinase n=1 Tax=Cryptosporangium sp. NPDC048952 TaxID=3363961 RepID=UPI00371972A3
MSRDQIVRVLLCAFASGGLVAATGWPYWQTHPVRGLVAGLACAGFAAAGALLASGGERRALTGRLLLLAAFCWPFAWLVSWDSGPGPALSYLCQGGFWVLAGTAILSYPTGVLVARRYRAFVAGAATVMLGGGVVLLLVSKPEWLGLPTTVSGFGLLARQGAFDVWIRFLAAAQVVLAAWFTALLWIRARWLSNLDRRIAIPVLVAAAALALVSSAQAFVHPGAWTHRDQLQEFYFSQGVIALVVSTALVSGALRDRWWELSAPHRVVRITSSGTSVATVRVALAEALRDRSLRLFFWAPVENGWVDVRGLPAVPGEADDERRWRISVDGLQHPLAIVEVDAALRNRPLLVDAVLRAGSPALLTAQLQAAASANLAQVLAAQERLAERELAERQRLEQELVDGAQHRLDVLARRLHGLTVHTSDPAVLRFAGECQQEVRATVGELEALARGLLPAALAERGLGPALETVVRRLGLAARVEVIPERLPAAVEATLYFALCEGLTNVAKYAEGAAVTVRVAVSDGWASGFVSDDGPGGAGAKPGGGLAGIVDRARVLSGWAAIDSTPSGTQISVHLPLDVPLVA